MQATSLPKDIDRLLAEADELIKQIDSDAIRDMEEEHRIKKRRRLLVWFDQLTAWSFPK